MHHHGWLVFILTLGIVAIVACANRNTVVDVNSTPVYNRPVVSEPRVYVGR